MKKLLLLALVLLALLPCAQAQEEGTADFNLIYLPQFKSELPEEVKETSGLFMHNGRLWTHNDSGGKPILYALDTTELPVTDDLWRPSGAVLEAERLYAEAAGAGASRLEITVIPCPSSSPVWSPGRQDQRSTMRASGFVICAPRAKALMEAGTPRMG